MASANPCPRPKSRILVKGIPTRLGPSRSCIQALKRLSAVTLPGTKSKTTPATATALIKAKARKTRSGALINIRQSIGSTDYAKSAFLESLNKSEMADPTPSNPAATMKEERKSPLEALSIC